MIGLLGHLETAVMRKRPDGVNDPAERAGADAVRVAGKLLPALCARLIAKVASGYAVSWLGLASISPTIVDTIHNNGTAINRWVGGSGDMTQMNHDPGETHAVRVWVAQDATILAQVCLFADASAPQYVVVVGTHTPPTGRGA